MTVYKSKKPTKDGRQYFFRIKYKDIFGEIHDYTSQKYKGSKEAKDEEAKYRIKINEQKVSASNITFKYAFEEYEIEKAKTIKKVTLTKHRLLFRYLKPIENEIIDKFTLEKHKKFVAYVDNLNVEIGYKNKILGLYKNIIIHSNVNYGTKDFVVKYITKYKDVNSIKKEMNFFTYEEYLKFDSVITEHKWHTFFEVLFFLGLRQGECQALTFKDINIENETISITKTLTTKLKGEEWTISTPKTQNSIRTLPLTKNLSNDLKIMLNEAMNYKDFEESWFVFGNSIPFKETTIQKHKNNYCKQANLKQIRIHDFRHSCASLLINKGASVTLVSKYLGHANITITLNTYTHFYQKELKSMTDLLNNL